MNLRGLVQRFRRWRLASAGVRLERSVVVGRDVAIGGAMDAGEGSVRIGPDCELGNGVQLHAWGGAITLGSRVFLGPYVVVYGHGGVEIGDNTLVSMHCCILSSNHSLATRTQIIRNQPDVTLPTTIGPDCWLGAGVKVLGGVRIARGCIVGAGAVVTGDLPEYSIAVGVPARVVGQRA